MYPVQNQEKYSRGFSFKQLYPAGWGELTGKPHLGIDIQCPVGTPIYAPFDGKLTNSVGKAGGNTAVLSNSRYSVRCLHLSEFITPGNVKKGAIMGYTGGAKGAEGSGTSSGPHLHVDVWKGKVNLSDQTRLINPDDFFSEIKVLVVGEREYDLEDVKRENPYLEITQMQKVVSPKWIEKREVDENWFDLNVWKSGYDIVALITKEYEKEGTLGYAEMKQRLGAFRCLIHDSGKERQSGKGWRKTNQVAGTLEHEINHLLFSGCNETDRTHELDKGEGFPVRPLSQFKRFELKGKVRLFKKSFYTGNIIERIVNEKSFIPKLYEGFGFKKEL